MGKIKWGEINIMEDNMDYLLSEQLEQDKADLIELLDNDNVYNEILEIDKLLKMEAYNNDY